MPYFMYMRELFKRDYSSRYYSAVPFTVALFLVELPYLVLAATVCFFSCYWASGFNTGTGVDGFYFWLSFVLFVVFCHSAGMFVA